MTGTWNCNGSTFTVSQHGCSGGSATEDIKFSVSDYVVTFAGQQFRGLTAVVNKLVTEIQSSKFVCQRESGKSI